MAVRSVLHAVRNLTLSHTVMCVKRYKITISGHSVVMSTTYWHTERFEISKFVWKFFPSYADTDEWAI